MYTQKLSKISKYAEASAIRELLKVVNQPGMISLAGGLPSKEALDLTMMGRYNDLLVQKYGFKLLQYNQTEGLTEFREALVPFLKKQKNIDVTKEEVFVSSGSQPALDAVFKSVIDEEDFLLIENPTYLTAIKAAKAYTRNIIAVDCDDDGIIISKLKEALDKYSPKAIYLIPTFQNPTGKTMHQKRREELINLMKDYDVLIIEDDPYGDLRYSGVAPQSLYSMNKSQVIHIGSFSKIFSPGLRIGYYIGPELVCNTMNVFRQGIEVQPNTYGQALATEMILSGEIYTHVDEIIQLYKAKLDVMLGALEDNFDKSKWNWTKPEGGMFVWLEGPKDFNAKEMYPKAIEKMVAYVPGMFFFADHELGQNTLRLNFTNGSLEDIKTGIERLGEVFGAK